ncbi:MAG: hypothetical protein AB1801_22945 [Chloroflexota bacterium]
MKQLLKIIGLGLALWALSLIWLELNILLLWPLFAGLVAGLVPAYFLGRWLNTGRPGRLPAAATRPTRRPGLTDPADDPTRPSPPISARPTRPMPAL